MLDFMMNASMLEQEGGVLLFQYFGVDAVIA